MKTIIFVALQLSQPRCIKRIKSIYEEGYKIKVYGFDSGLYNDNLKTLPFPVECIIKRNKNEKLPKKIANFISHIWRILKDNPNGNFYLFGFEIASIAWILGCRRYIYEEADVTAARIKNGIFRSIMLQFDRIIIKHSYRTVFTSGGFVSYIFSRNIPNDKLLILPNKLSPYFNAEKKEQVKASSVDVTHIKFAFIGLVRYPQTITRFAKVIGQYFPNHEFHFWGDIEKDEYIDDMTRTCENVYIHGRFNNPSDLMYIYSQTDISIVCYDTASGNVRIAEPNKIYESIFFETPIVVSSNTFLAERIKELQIGYVIDANNDQSIIKFITELSSKDINVKIKNMQAIPWQQVVDNPKELLEALKEY